MSNNIDLKSIWGRQEHAPKPDITEVINKARGLKNKIRNRLLLSNICLVATVLFIAYIGVVSDFAMVTTRIGVILIIVAIVFYVAVSNGLLISVFKTNPEADNITYLNELLTIRKKQEYLQGKMLTLYFILLTAGFVFYMTEFLLRMSLLWAIVAGTITFGWIAFNWFYIRPRTVRKQQKALNDMIAKLEQINDHYKEDAE